MPKLKQEEKKERIIEKIEKNLDGELFDFGLKIIDSAKEDEKKYFFNKTRRRKMIEERLVPAQMKSDEFSSFLAKYKTYRQTKTIVLQDLIERIELMDELGMKKNKIYLSVSEMEEAYIYAEGLPYLETKNMNFETLNERMEIMLKRNKKRRTNRFLTKVQLRIKEMGEDGWEKERGKNKSKFISSIDKKLEEMMNFSETFDCLLEMVEKDLELVKKKTLLEARKNKVF